MTTKTDKIVVCDFCKRNYCVQFGFRRDLAKYYDKLTKRNALSNREKRFKHQNWTRMYHGVLGKGAREPVPVCVQDKIAHKFPRNNEGKAVGFKNY